MNIQSSGNLFRPEVAEARRLRLEGDIILRQPMRSHLMAILLTTIVCALAAWIGLGQYARSEMAPGFLVTDKPTAKIVAMRPGRVLRLLIHDGDQVHAGDLLAVIETEQPNMVGRSTATETIKALDAQSSIADRQASLAMEKANAERGRLRASLGGLQAQERSLRSQIELQKEVVVSTRAIFDRLGTIVDRGFISQVEVERRRQALLTTQQQLSQLSQQASALRSQKQDIGAQIRKSFVDAAVEVGAAQSNAASIRGQEVQLEAERAYQVRATISGRVTAVQTAVGRLADPSVPLMSVVPEFTRLHAELYAPSRAIGFIEERQEVRLLYDAFPYERFGSFKGVVERVSRTAIAPQDITALKLDGPVYRIDVAIQKQQVDAFGQAHSLQPGMTLEANLILDKRSFSDWLLEPIRAVMRRT